MYVDPLRSNEERGGDDMDPGHEGSKPVGSFEEQAPVDQL
jgi:hypothetical protein